jgi:CRISPR/Cas system endoribonuclease Cas6 (RAMP superfamily)
MKEFATELEKQNTLDEFKRKLLALKTSISELKHIEVGTHYLLQSPSFDLCLISHFNSIDDLKAYQVHPEHVKVGEFVKTCTIERAAVDFEY